MRSPMRPTRVVILACGLLLATLAPAAAVAPPRPAGLIAQIGLGLTVEVPAPGYGVAASADMTDGRHLDLVLETGADGVTRRIPDALGAAADGAASDAHAAVARAAGGARITGGGSACSDDAYNLLPMKWFSTWNWWFNARSTPSEITKAKAERQLRSAVASITGSRNDCGMADTVSARASYRGRTNTRPNINGDLDPMCRARDGKSVVGFGDLPMGILGLTCTTYQKISGVDRAIESDVLLNKRYFDWRTSVTGCDNAAIVRSVATHEFGHVFGLNHVGEGSHGRLTMSESIGTCDDSAFTLGRGDVLALRRRY